MDNELLLIGGLLAYFIIILVARRIETIPYLVFWNLSRNIESEDYNLLTPNDIGLNAEIVEIPMGEKSINAWFFPNKAKTPAGVLMVPNWYQKEDHENNLKTARVLHSAGYHVLLPIFHWYFDDKMEVIFSKRNISPKKCQEVISYAYDYFITRPEVDKKYIGIWSNGFGTVLACQLIKNTPIKAVILEDGPVNLWNYITDRLQTKKNFPYLPTKLILVLLLFPFLWRTRWESKKSIKNLRACPSFVISLRGNPQKKMWQTYLKLYKPSQFWDEHAINPHTIRDTWTQEYFSQVRLFFDFWLLDSKKPEFHYDFSVKRKKKGKHMVEIRIVSFPPQIEKIPLQIILSDNFRFSELRIWFSGGSMTITYPFKYKPNNISVLQFTNVEATELPHQQWLKRDAEKALYTTIDTLTQYPPKKLTEYWERYYFLKGVLLNEQNLKKDAQETISTSIKSKNWKTIVNSDPDTRIILQKDLEEPIVAISDKTLMKI